VTPGKHGFVRHIDGAGEHGVQIGQSRAEVYAEVGDDFELDVFGAVRRHLDF
jgi:hypothetical protein